MSDPTTPICPDCRTDDNGESYVCDPALMLCPLNRTSESFRPLACTYCGGKLTVDTETTGRAYLSYEVPESITCDEMGCQAVWEPDGTPRELPAFVRFPSLYTRPELVRMTAAPTGPDPRTDAAVER